MQDRYAGDVGDFVKLGLLRALMPGRRLGVAWYRYPDEVHNSDGRHIGYLDLPEKYGHLDPELFAHLRGVVRKDRTISSLLPALPHAVSFDESLALANVPSRQRREWRAGWFERALTSLECCDLVFADPDNSIVDDADKRKGVATFGKQMPLAEVHALAEGRCAVIYHHNTRRAGGHDAEVDHWIDQIEMPTIVVRTPAYSPRTFFIINPDQGIRVRTGEFCARWSGMKVRLHQGP
jgi:hypothetical protein